MSETILRERKTVDYVKLYNISKFIVNNFSHFLNNIDGNVLKFFIGVYNERNVIVAFSYSNFTEGDNIENMIYNELLGERNTIAYSQAEYYRELEGIYRGYLMSVGKGVYSLYGGGLGHFLFLLQILLSIMMDVKVYSLENYTNDPVRAAQGIYREFEIDKREEDRSNYVGMSLEDQLHLSEGRMRHDLYSNSKRIIMKSIKDLFLKILQNEGDDRYNIWNFDNIRKYLGYGVLKRGIDSSLSRRKTKKSKTIKSGGSQKKRRRTRRKKSKVKRGSSSYFEFKKGSSRKFWRITKQGNKITTQYGKLGSLGNMTTKDYGSKADQTYDKLVKAKKKKGYIEKVDFGDPNPKKPTAVEREYMKICNQAEKNKKLNPSMRNFDCEGMLDQGESELKWYTEWYKDAKKNGEFNWDKYNEHNKKKKKKNN